MCDSDKPENMQLIPLEELKQHLAARNAEIVKLQTRLKGYETVAQLAKNRENTNKELVKKVTELELEKERANNLRKETVEKQTSTEAMSESLLQPAKTEFVETNDMSSREGLNDLRSSVALTSPQTGSSSSFSIIGKSSRDTQLSPSHIDVNVTPSYQSFTNSFGMLQDDFNLSSGKIVSEEKAVTKSNHMAHEPAVINEEGGIEDFIQVFPQGSQSGGSDFYEPSFEKEMNGGQSLMDSSRRGPMSIIIAANNGSIPSYQYVEVKKEEKQKEAEQNEDPTMITFDATPSSRVPGTYNGTGARPKQTSFQSKTTTGVGEEISGEGEIRDSVETAESKQKLVRIPNEDRDYRINNAPMLPFGRGESQTEISALTSFGSELDSLKVEKPIQEPEQYNNLNLGPQESFQMSTREQTVPKIAIQEEYIGEDPLPSLTAKEKSCLATQALTIRNILSSKTNISETRNIILQFLNEVEELERVSKENEVENKQLRLLMTKIPPSIEMDEKEHPTTRNDQDKWVILSQLQTNDDIHKAPIESIVTDLEEKNNALKIEIERLRNKTNQLHVVNKEWKDRWELLKKQKEDENLQLKENVQLLMQERERLRRETELVITSQKEELNEVNCSKREIEKDMTILRSGKSQEKQLLEQLKQDYGTMHQEKRALEIQLETLKANNLENSRPMECIQKKSELETELSIVKRQVALFMDDFNKEHQEKLSTETRLQKAKESSQSLEAKLKKAHDLLKSRDEDLRQKAKRACDLQFEVDNLKLKLEIEQRRASIYPSMDVEVPSIVQQENSHYLIPADFVGTARSSSDNVTVNTHITNANVTTSKRIVWNCPSCTFQNRKDDAKCQMCLTPYKGTVQYIEVDISGN